MRNILLKVLVVSGLIFSSQHVFGQTALEMNDRIVSITDSLYADGRAWGAKFTEVVKIKEFEKLAPLRIDMENFISRKIIELGKMKDVGGSKELREGMISFLQFEMKMSQTGFAPIEKLNPKSTDEEIKAAFQNLQNASKDETAKLAEFNTLQQDYAKKNGFKIEGE